jgi:predicted branched-subunit amino acid permease
MDDSSKSLPAVPTWSFAGLTLGVQLALPVLPGMVAFALAVGVTAARKGFSFIDMVLMNGLVYAGASQMVAMEIWPDRVTLGAAAALGLVTATVNARLLLMSASLRPWLAPLPWWQSYPMLHLTTDPGWLIAMRYRAEGGNDAGVFLGGGLVIFATWMTATAAGYLLGASIPDPRRFGLDLVMPIFFAIMLIPLWHGVSDRAKRAFGWIVAGAVALAVERLVAGWWFIIAGAIAGAVVEGFIEGTDDER